MSIIYDNINKSYGFQAVDKSLHSTGTPYLTLCNNPHHICFIHEETMLLIAMPSPIEPSCFQMNKIMELAAEDFLEQGKGMVPSK
jgi:hypothetical protein